MKGHRDVRVNPKIRFLASLSLSSGLEAQGPLKRYLGVKKSLKIRHLGNLCKYEEQETLRLVEGGVNLKICVQARRNDQIDLKK